MYSLFFKQHHAMSSKQQKFFVEDTLHGSTVINHHFACIAIAISACTLKTGVQI